MSAALRMTLTAQEEMNPSLSSGLRLVPQLRGAMPIRASVKNETVNAAAQTLTINISWPMQVKQGHSQQVVHPQPCPSLLDLNQPAADCGHANHATRAIQTIACLQAGASHSICVAMQGTAASLPLM